MLAGRNQDLATQVPTLLLRGELIFPVNACGTSNDHPFHQFKGIERATKASFSVGHDRSKPIDAVVAV